MQLSKCDIKDDEGHLAIRKESCDTSLKETKGKRTLFPFSTTYYTANVYRQMTDELFFKSVISTHTDFL